MPEPVRPQFTVYVPVGMRGLVERLIALGEGQRHTLNWVAIQALTEYVEREEAKCTGAS
jgi:predicted transcriptional regulator